MGNGFYVGAGGFVVGVLVRSFADFGFALPIFLLIVAGAIFILGKLVSPAGRPRRPAGPLIIPIFILTLALGILRYDLADRNRADPILDEKIGAQITLTGIINEEPDNREETTLLVVKLKEYHSADKKESPLKSRALVSAPHYPNFSYGDLVEIRGRLDRPKPFIAEGRDKAFNYPSYLAREQIYYLVYEPKLTLIERDRGNFLKGKLFLIKSKFLQAVGEVLPEPENSLLAGVLVGTKQSLGQTILDQFRRVGIIHIVVLSGYNLTVVASFIMKLFSPLPRRLPLALGAFSIILFAIMTGGGATVVRASFMVLIALLGKATGRPYAAGRALIIAGLLMLLHNPKILVFDPSFELSFLATLGLIYIAPIFERRLRFLTERFGIREITAATIGTQLAVLPLLLYQTGIFSLVSLPANLLVLPVIPPAMLFGFLAGLVSLLSPVVALPFAAVTYFLLVFVFSTAEQLGRLPFAAVTMKTFPFWLTVILYGLLVLFVWNANRRETLSR